MQTTRILAAVGAAALALGAITAASLTGSTAIAQPADAPAAKPASSSAAGMTFKVDPVHSSVVYKIKHMGVTDFYGRFDTMSGSFTLGDTLSGEVSVDAASVNTNNPKRDDHVRSPDFFNAAEFPKVTFTAKDLPKAGEGVYKGQGSLTFHGVTKPVTVEVHTATGKGRQGATLGGLNTTFTIKQSDFGIKGAGGGLSDEVTLMIGIEGGAK